MGLSPEKEIDATGGSFCNPIFIAAGAFELRAVLLKFGTQLDGNTSV